MCNLMSHAYKYSENTHFAFGSKLQYNYQKVIHDTERYMILVLLTDSNFFYRIGLDPLIFLEI